MNRPTMIPFTHVMGVMNAQSKERTLQMDWLALTWLGSKCTEINPLSGLIIFLTPSLTLCTISWTFLIDW